MKKTFLFSACAVLSLSMAACGGNPNKAKEAEAKAETKAEAKAMPAYNVLENEQVDLSAFPKDKDGYYVLFDGKTFNGWRGYGKQNVPVKWTIDNGAIKFNGTGGGEAQKKDGGDLIFAHKFKNFELEVEWMVSKGGNSGIFYLAQEVEAEKNGKMKMQPIYISCPEYQVLDNANHPDAKLGVDGNRQSASLYDMIPAVPQNQKPYGEWNKAKITVYKGTVIHSQNDVNVVEYHLWTPEWTEMLENSKFSPAKRPLAFELLNNCGGENHEGYIGFQDHGDDVWFRNIRIKVLD
ncbi:3-keto-disaccharide hydrolase [Alistipes sp.]|uniref:3-keto-disaccharide hydrolase n=1 Tax=Alistipes sp. TaxID=1872444 RepID=UPI003A88CFBB